MIIVSWAELLDDEYPISDERSVTHMGNEQGADLIVTGGKVVTLDAAETITQAVAVQDGKILKVGSDDVVQAVAGPKTVHVSAGGKLVVPGPRISS